jgi:prepilin-type processing-associated H-X9-DG protein
MLDAVKTCLRKRKHGTQARVSSRNRTALDHARRAVRPGGGPPVVLDCMYAIAYGRPCDEPPVYEGAFGSGDPDTKFFCLDRHSGGVNATFLDGSVRKVGIKELWTLLWCESYNPAGPWTKAGGVRPEDWPAWMRKPKDY